MQSLVIPSKVILSLSEVRATLRMVATTCVSNSNPNHCGHNLRDSNTSPIFVVAPNYTLECRDMNHY